MAALSSRKSCGPGWDRKESVDCRNSSVRPFFHRPGARIVDVRQSRLIEDLSDSFTGELSTNIVDCAMYACDGSLYQVPPWAVACPRSAEDASTLVRYAFAENIPIIPRGSGSSVTGGALGRGIVVDCSRHLREITFHDDDTVHVQAGVVLDDLNRALRRRGRYFPPDPASAATTTIGSMLAVDAAGSHAISVGSTRDHVLQLDAVMVNGEQRHLGRETWPGPEDETSSEHHRRLVSLRQALRSHELAIRAALTTGLRRRGGGYYVYDVASPEGIDLPRLLIGSEGTLALFTGATLHTLPLPQHRGAMLILFETIETAARAVTRLVEEEPAACDLLDRRLLNLARETSAEFADLIPGSAEAALIVEWSGWSAAEVLRRLDRFQRLIREFVPGCAVQCEATTPAGADFLWSLPRQVVPLLHRLQGLERPLPFVEDIAVPPEYLEEFIFRAQKIFQRHNVVSSLYAHAPTGQLHLRPFLSLPTPADASHLQGIAADLYEAAWHLGGTVSGEHGLGLVRSQFVRKQAGPLYALFEQIKQIFDPRGILNPDKVISQQVDLMTRDLRAVHPPVEEVHELQLSWNRERLVDAAISCNGCGRCRTAEPGSRMCPVFRDTPDESASPRAKANLMRQVLLREIPDPLLASPEFKRVADQCFNCRQCQLECPSGVDIPHLVQEIKAQHVEQNGLSRGTWFLTRSMDWGEWLNRASFALNPLLKQPAVRWLTEKLFGVHHRRKLPPIASRSFLRQVEGSRTSSPMTLGKSTVIYFVDYFANHHDPDLAWACVKVLEQQGLAVHVPPRQQRCGMELIAAGDLDWARSIAEENIKVLVEFAREGCPILCSEPTAALCLKQDYPLLLGTEDAQVVASQTLEVGQYLQQLEQQGRLSRELSELPFRVAYHLPCHQRVLSGVSPLLELCRQIPGLAVQTLDAGCSGMAGMFGMEARTFDQSLRIGRELQRQWSQSDALLGMTECSSCRLQMEQGVARTVVHPLKLLAAAYEGWPELEGTWPTKP